MNYSEVIALYENAAVGGKKAYLCSGADRLIAESVINDIIFCASGSAVVINDSGLMEKQIVDIICRREYNIVNGMSDGLCYHDIFDVSDIMGMSRIRILLSTAGFSEMQIQRVIAYLSFVKHVEKLAGNECNISLDVLAKYSTNMEVKGYLDSLRTSELITNEQYVYLIAKYSEIASSAADFENVLMVMGRFITGNLHVKSVIQTPGQALYIPLYMMGRDAVMKAILLEMMTIVLSDAGGVCGDIILLDNGRENSGYLSDFIQDNQRIVKNIHVISQDIFLADRRLSYVIMHNADIRIYSRHNNMESCGELEKLLGDMDVVKQTYGVDYPRQWKANSAWDILLGNNKVEHYNWNAPVREPRYRKEDINSFPQGVGIVNYYGHSSIFSIC